MPQQLAPKPYRSLPVSQRYDGLGRGFDRPLAAAKSVAKQVLLCRLEVLQLSLLGHVCGGRGAVTAEMPAAVKRFSGDASSKSLKYRRWSLGSISRTSRANARRETDTAQLCWWPAQWR